MTREEIKRRAELYSALAEGKTIQILNMEGNWIDVEVKKLNHIPETLKFRIKPEPQYRPFKTQEECWNEMLKHQPFGWIEHKETEDYYNILGICKITEITKILMSDCSCAFPELFDEFIFIDGTPFGIKEE